MTGRLTRLASFAVMVAVLVLAIYFLVRGAWWVSAILILLQVAIEGGLWVRKRKQ